MHLTDLALFGQESVWSSKAQLFQRAGYPGRSASIYPGMNPANVLQSRYSIQGHAWLLAMGHYMPWKEKKEKVNLIAPDHDQYFWNKIISLLT